MSLARNRKITQLQSQYMMQQERDQQINQRRKRGLVRRLTLFGILVLVSTVVMVSTIFSQSSAINEKISEQKKLEEELSHLERDEKLLEEEIIKLNDDEYIAKIARRDYFLSDENEIIFNIPESE
ncbi:septum formation initiator family protein [Metabacillus herbersteinensis]|uniref:Septum formation initiator family protein n=1 Tax=Metabacillus herbersteinensis TaxID=283816 RepID=A0ABV6GKS0_9BACI